MSTDLQPVYAASVEINATKSGWGLYFGPDDKRNKSGSLEGDVFSADLAAINEILLIALKEGAYGYNIYTTSDKVISHITRAQNHGDLAELQEIRANLQKLLQNKVDVKFDVIKDAGDRDTMAKAEKLAAQG